MVVILSWAIVPGTCHEKRLETMNAELENVSEDDFKGVDSLGEDPNHSQHSISPRPFFDQTGFSGPTIRISSHTTL
jgi:hypothetical protein